MTVISSIKWLTATHLFNIPSQSSVSSLRFLYTTHDAEFQMIQQPQILKNIHKQIPIVTNR